MKNVKVQLKPIKFLIKIKERNKKTDEKVGKF